MITLYSLVMAAMMITGGKLGDSFGRRRTSDERVAPALQQELAVELSSGLTFVSSAEVTAALEQSQLDEGTQAASFESYKGHGSGRSRPASRQRRGWF